MAIRKRILTAMKMEVINPEDVGCLPREGGSWYELEKRPVDMPEEVWKGPGVYLWDIDNSVWKRILIEE